MRRSLLLAVLLALLGATPAVAFTPPELYIRLTHANSIDHEPVSDWMPLATTPALHWLGGYEVGYAFEDSAATGDSQHAALEVIGVPDGQPTQPLNTPYCLGGPGAIGTITPVGVALQFEGSGSYTVRVSVGPATGGRNDCMGGADSASSTASFSADAQVVPALAGSPLIFRARRPASDAFVGVDASDPPGGQADTRCARDATIAADGSVSGKVIAPQPDPQHEDDSPLGRIGELTFPRPGAWTCVSRGSSEGIDPEINRLRYGTPWSAPLTLDVRSDFRRATGRIIGARAKRPALRFTSEFPEASAGGTGTFVLRRFTGCRSGGAALKRVGSFTARFAASGRIEGKLRRPSSAYYVGALSFSGTRFYTRSTDPSPVLLSVSRRGALSFVKPTAFPLC